MEEENRIRVDEPLISTDVDNLIRIISEKKKVSLGRLRSLGEMDKRTLEKWVGVLEDEGYISIEYGLTGTYVVWKGDPVEEVEYQTPKPPEIVIEKKEESPTLSFFSEKEEESPEERLNRYLESKKTSQYQENETKSRVKDNILENLADDVENEPDISYLSEDPESEDVIIEDDGHYSSDIYEDSEETDMEIQDSEPEEKAVKEPEKKKDISKERHKRLSLFDFSEKPEQDVSGPAEETSIPELQISEPAPDSRAVKDLVDAYISEMKKEKEKLSELKKQQYALYREKMIPLEEKMETDVVSITERIMELQNRIHELKNGVLELPGKVDEVESIQNEMSSLGVEARAALKRTKETSNSFVEGIRNAQKEVQSKIEKSRSTISEEENLIGELQRTSKSLESRSENIRNAIDGLQVQMSEIDNEMKGLLDGLEEAADMKNQVSDMVDEANGVMREQSEQLENFENELAEVEKMEHWVKEYVDDYQRKIGGIEDYVKNSDRELEKLKETAEANYMKRYLSKLEDMAEDYDGQLGSALEQNRDLEKDISETKERIAELLKESREMVKKLRSEADDAPEFSPIVSKAKRNAEKIKKTVEEKEKEREELTGDIKKKKKGRKKKKRKSKKQK